MTFQGVEELVGEFVFLNLLHPPPPLPRRSNDLPLNYQDGKQFLNLIFRIYYKSVVETDVILMLRYKKRRNE